MFKLLITGHFRCHLGIFHVVRATMNTVSQHDWFKLSNSASVGSTRSGGQSLMSGVARRGIRDLPDNTKKIKVLRISDQGDASKKICFATF